MRRRFCFACISSKIGKRANLKIKEWGDQNRLDDDDGDQPENDPNHHNAHDGDVMILETDYQKDALTKRAKDQDHLQDLQRPHAVSLILVREARLNSGIHLDRGVDEPWAEKDAVDDHEDSHHERDVIWRRVGRSARCEIACVIPRRCSGGDDHVDEEPEDEKDVESDEHQEPPRKELCHSILPNARDQTIPLEQENGEQDQECYGGCDSQELCSSSSIGELADQYHQEEHKA